MAHDVRAYLDIEHALYKRLSDTWRGMASKIFAPVGEAVRAGQFAKAYELAKDIDLAEVGEKNREWIKYMLLAAAVYGAKNVHGGDSTVLQTGSYEKFLTHITSNFIRTLEHNCTIAVYKQLVQAIAKYNHKVLIKKTGNPYHDSEGKFCSADEAVNSGEDIWYHGSTVGGKGFSENETHINPGLDGAVWLTKDKGKAESYARNTARDKGGVATVFFVNGVDAKQDPDNYGDDWVRSTKEKVKIRGKYYLESAVEKAEGDSNTVSPDEIGQEKDNSDIDSLPDDDNESFVKEFVSFAKTGDDQLQLIASLHTSRLAVWGFTAECEVLGVTRYRLQAVLDGRTSKFCREIDGREFDVEEARKTIVKALQVTNPDDIKSIQPWPAQTKAALDEYPEMTEDELVARGFHVPPFHPSCRTICVKVGTVKNYEDQQVVEDGQEGDTPEDGDQGILATRDNFDELGVDLTQDQVDDYNHTCGLDPVMVLAMLSGFAGVDVLGSLLEGELVWVDSEANVGFDFSADGASVTQVLDPANDLLIQQELELSGMSVDDAADYVQRLFGQDLALAQMVEADGILAQVGGENGAYAYSQMGYVPSSASEWFSLRTGIVEDLTADGPLADVVSQLDDDQLKIVRDLLASRDEHALWTLTELPFEVNGLPVGQVLLSGRSFEAMLDVSDPDAIDRLQAYGP